MQGFSWYTLYLFKDLKRTLSFQPSFSEKQESNNSIIKWMLIMHISISKYWVISLLLRLALRVASRGKTAILPFSPAFARMTKDFQSIVVELFFQLKKIFHLLTIDLYGFIHLAMAMVVWLDYWPMHYLLNMGLEYKMDNYLILRLFFVTIETCIIKFYQWRIAAQMLQCFNGVSMC